MALQVGSIIQNKYRIEELLGNGSIGQVFRGRHLALKKQVAIKVLRPENAHRPDVVARFEREAQVGAHVIHPNIAAAMDLGQLDDGSRFLVLELVRGVTLRDVIQRGPLSLRRAALVGLGIARALQCLHEAGIVHRDLKPANVMLVDGEEEHTKLIDFGLARLESESELLSELSGNSGSWDTITTEGQFLGTIAYVAPEVRHGMEAIGASADLYALGVLLFEMLVGQRPFIAKTAAEVLRKQLTEPPPAVESLVSESLPKSFSTLIHQLLTKEPEQRPSTAEVLRTLEEIVRSLGSASMRPRPSMADWEATGQVILPGPDLMEPGETMPSTPTIPVPPLTPRDSVSLLPPRSTVSPHRKSLTALLLGALTIVALSVGLWWKPRVTNTTVAQSNSALQQALLPSESAPPSQEATPSLSATTSRPTPEGLAALPPELQLQVDRSDWVALQKSLIALGETNPEIYRREDIQKYLTQCAIGLSRKAPKLLQDLCTYLAVRPSGDGADALYQLHMIPGNSVLFFRSKEGLTRSVQNKTASPALQFTLELLWTPCSLKIPMISHAVERGDERTRQQLEALRTTECAKQSGCCLKQLPQLGEIIEQLQKK